ncbi:MAG: hypothetical protein KGL39_31675, partial [Patescibacteria group bacterium]|nr:hypothetical protein [Patescibacteria group bacterium]
ARDARTALDASDARDALDASDALDALAALDASDALASLKRFAAWCVNRGGWWYASEFSWLSTTYFGAKQIRKPEVARWSEPVLNAFLAGAWFVHWTDDTLFWIAKPVVHTETIPNGLRRLHNDSFAAVESDLENLYFLHGVLVPAFVVVKPEWITTRHIGTEKNAEVQRLMIERYGWTRYLADMRATVIDSRQNDVECTREALMQIADKKVLVCHCPSTARVYAMEVDPQVTTAEQAQNYLWSGSRLAQNQKLNIIGRS